MRIVVACTAASLTCVLAVGAGIHAAGAPERVPVVVELFTSEGCSDCPPADNVLAQLAAQPVPGADIIALGEHVDYWDKQGWKDPFSSSAFTARQVDYGRALHVENIYTPQMIVNGRDEFVGSNYTAAADAIARATRASKQQLAVSMTVERTSSSDAFVRLNVDAPHGVTSPHPADVFLAVTEDGLTSKVERGENRGKTLLHVGVVRQLQIAASWDGKKRPWSGSGDVHLEPQWQLKNARVVAFVQDHSSRAIIGAVSAPLH